MLIRNNHFSQGQLKKGGERRRLNFYASPSHWGWYHDYHSFVFAQPSIHPSLARSLHTHLDPVEVKAAVSVWRLNDKWLECPSRWRTKPDISARFTHSHTEIRGAVTHQTPCTSLTLMCLPVWASARISALQTGAFTPLSGSQTT